MRLERAVQHQRQALRRRIGEARIGGVGIEGRDEIREGRDEIHEDDHDEAHERDLVLLELEPEQAPLAGDGHVPAVQVERAAVFRAGGW